MMEKGETMSKIHDKVEQVRRRVQRDLARRAARVEEGIEAEEVQRDHMHDVHKQGDIIDALDLLTINQQSRYDVYADSQGPASTRPLDE
jgi:hypothetical protein